MKFRPLNEPFQMSLGQRGEIRAWQYLLEQGFSILAKNHRSFLGEIDVVAKKNGRLYFIEIKTRRSSRFGLPQEAVDRNKQHKILRLAENYLKEKKLWGSPVSLSVLAVFWQKNREPSFRFFENGIEG